MIIIFLFWIGYAYRKKADKVMDERITLNLKDNIPYGTGAVKKLLPHVFPGAAIFTDSRSPGNWDSLSYENSNQVAILIGNDFYADEEQLSRINFFAREGNYVFIIAKNVSLAAERFFNFSLTSNVMDYYPEYAKDSLLLKLESNTFDGKTTFAYPGKRYQSYFDSIDPVHSIVLGRNEEGYPDFIAYKTGKGYIFIHSAPLAFSNYFILHKSNYQYFEKVLSVIPKTVTKVDWNEYYLVRRNEEGEPSWLNVLFKFPSFKWGLLTAMLLLLLYALVYMRRRQKVIPPYQKPVNDSLDFIKTLGRLYYDRQDHKNMAGKMTVYFLEHVRSKYKINTQYLDQAFTESLSYKSGYPAEDTISLMNTVNQINAAGVITEKELSVYYNQLEKFYQNT